MNKYKLTERPDIYWAFNGEVSEKILTDCFNELRLKIKRVLELEDGIKPLIKRLKVKGEPNLRLSRAIANSQREERIRETITDPKDQAIFAISTTHRKPKNGIANKRLSQEEITRVLSEKYGIKLSQQKVSKRLGRLKQRAIFVLHMGGLTQREIAKLGIKSRTSLEMVNRDIAKGYEEYGD